MPTHPGILINQHFTPHTADSSERELMSDMVAEAIEITGVQGYYMPFSDSESEIDVMLDEYIGRVFRDGYPIPTYVSNSPENSGDNDLMTKFGITYMDDYGFVFSRQHFESLNVPNRTISPAQGDLLYIPLLKTLFTINNVPHRHQLSQLGQQFALLLKCSPYSPSIDLIQTGDQSVNNIGDGLASFESDRNYNQNNTSAIIGESLTLPTDDPFGGY